MTLRVVAALGCWLALAPVVRAQPRNVTVSGPTRLDWEFVAGKFRGNAADALDKYESKKQRYQLFIPGNYSRKRTWPLIVFISPGNDPVGWASFEYSCE